MNNTGRPPGARTSPRVYELKKKLIRRGYQSIRDWGDRHGFNSRTVQKVVSRYWDLPDVQPTGAQSILILEALELTIGQPAQALQERRSGLERRHGPGRRAGNHLQAAGGR